MAKGIKTGGRAKGTPNKSTECVRERLAELDCDPVERLVRVGTRAEKEGELSVAAQIYKELGSYIYPKRKAIDVAMFPNEDASRHNITVHYVGAEDYENGVKKVGNREVSSEKHCE